MCGHFADIEYYDEHGNLLSVSCQMNACNQVLQYTTEEGKPCILVGKSTEHTRLVYDLVKRRAPDYLKARQMQFSRVGRGLEALMFDCDDKKKESGEQGDGD
ncbi:MAG: hypothetical protein KA248_04570 [Kiritimatiellae bacterium]|nr:hypothetical protein [Kiritimatiellia bacterium]